MSRLLSRVSSLCASISNDGKLEIGTECQLELTLPDGQSPLSERARVTWAAEHPDGGWRHGLAFDDLSPAGEHRVRALVAGTA